MFNLTNNRFMRKCCLFNLHRKSPGLARVSRSMCLVVAFFVISVGTLMANVSTENDVSDLLKGVETLMEAKNNPQVKQKVLRGVVLGTEAKDTLAGVNVVIKGTTLGVVTDVHGKFTLPLPEKTDGLIICFSFIGKKKKEIKFTGQTDLRVILEDDNQEMEEVVITGYQTIEKRHLTSAVTTLKMDDIMLAGVNTVDKMLEGHVPGMIFMQNSGQV